jgi:hypothetical protein
MRSEARRVRVLRLDDTAVAISRATLSLSQDELAGGLPGRSHWSLYAHLASFAPIELGAYRVRAELEDGETLEGPGILTNWNGLTITLRSSDAWTGVSGW